MNISSIYTLVKAAKIIAILSLLGGALLLIVYFYADSVTILSIGMYYALFAILINSVLFFTLYFVLVRSNACRKKMLKSLIAMIINIPIGLCYIGVMMRYHIS